MWWLYVKACETEDLIVYHYSTESDDLDGKIAYNRKEEERAVTRPSVKDQDSARRIGKTEDNFRYVVEAGFPDRIMVGIG